MKRIYLIVWCFLSFQSAYSQQITNFYLEPGATPNEATLHTSFFHYYGAGLHESNIEIVDNVINASLCYSLSSTTVYTYDDQEFALSLPSGYPNFILNVDLFIRSQYTGECDYANSEDSGSFEFDFPYTATETTYVPDDTFEAYFETNGFGDDLPNNDYVFTHKVINQSNLDLEYSNISTLGPRIEDLTGIEILYRLKNLKVSDNEILQFEGAFHPQLEYLSVFNDQLESVNLTQNPYLWRLEIGGENLTDLDISANTNLEILGVGGAPNVSQLDLTSHLSLYQLIINNTGITSLDLTNNILLTYFNCKNNASLTTLIAGNPSNLTQLNCDNNVLEILDVSAFEGLIGLYAQGNNLTHLDLSQNINIKNVLIQDNNLVSLNLKNGFSQDILLLLGMNNPNLYCIEVDDETAAPYGNMWVFSQPVIYSEDCALGLNDSEQVQIVIYPNPVRNMLTIESKESIISIEVYSILGELLASERGVSQIDFSSYAKGIYFLKVDTEKGAVFQKVVKE